MSGIKSKKWWTEVAFEAGWGGEGWEGLERGVQRGLKYTENKPIGRHYLGNPRITMSSTVYTFTQGKGPIDPTCNQCTNETSG
jgi:hypothetical protein